MKSHMMLKSIPILLCLSLCFCSCNGTPVESTQTDTQNPVEETASVSETEAPSSTTYADAVYQDDTLSVLHLEVDVQNNDMKILPFGSNLLIATSPVQDWSDPAADTAERTVHLCIYDPVTGEDLHEADVTADGIDAYMVSITADGKIAVRDSLYQCIQFLDETLTVRATLTMPYDTIDAEISDINSLLADDAFTYIYFTLNSDNNIYKADLTTGDVSVLYTASSESWDVSLNDILFDSSVLMSNTYTYEGYQLQFISTADGSLLSDTTEYATIYTEGDRYYAILADSSTEGRLVYGTADSQRFSHTMMLENPYNWYHFCINPEAGTLLYCADNMDETYTLQCFNLEQGRLTAQNDLSSWLAAEDEACTLSASDSGVLDNHLYYVVMPDWENGFARLILWNPYKEPPAKDSYSTLPTLDASAKTDTGNVTLDAAYDEVRAYADTLENAYQIEIKIAEECNALNIDGYSFENQTDIAIIQNSLSVLEQGLSSFPEGFFAQLKSDVYPGGLVIYLCSTISGADSIISSTTKGLTYTDEQHHLLALYCEEESNLATFYHEMMHVMDNHILTLEYDSTQPDAFAEETWSTLNPEGFEYTYDYSNYDALDTSDTAVDSAPDGSLEQIYFMDNYSKVSPDEDRARIFEHALLSGGPFSGYDCPHITEKLTYICNYIRYHFNTEGWPEVVLWEKALQR